LGSERFQREIETVLGRRARHGQADSPNSMTMRTNRARCVQAWKQRGRWHLPVCAGTLSRCSC